MWQTSTYLQLRQQIGLLAWVIRRAPKTQLISSTRFSDAANRSGYAWVACPGIRRPHQMKMITCTACDKRGIEIPQRALADSRVACRDCGAVHTLSTLLRALDERHERNKPEVDPQK